MKLIGEKVVRDVLGYKCDICGTERKHMTTITSQHYDWGNDSPDSVKTFDVCKEECYEEKIRELCDSKSYKGRTSYFDDVPIRFWRHILKLEKEEK